MESQIAVDVWFCGEEFLWCDDMNTTGADFLRAAVKRQQVRNLLL